MRMDPNFKMLYKNYNDVPWRGYRISSISQNGFLNQIFAYFFFCMSSIAE